MKQPSEFLQKSPVQNRAEQTIETILEASAQVLDRHGPDKLTTNHVAERAGFSIGTLYSYFTNKDGIVRGMAIREMNRIETEVAAALRMSQGGTVEEIVRAVVRVALRAFQGRRGVRRSVMLWLASHEDMLVRLSAMLDRIGRAMVDAVSQSSRHPVRPLSQAARFILVPAMLAPIRVAVFKNSALLDDPDFENELVRLGAAFFRVDADDEVARSPGSGQGADMEGPAL